MPGKTKNTRERLLAAAREEFQTYGFESASLRRMATAVGIAAPSVYNYFASKEEMFTALVEPVIQKVEDTFHAVDARKQNQAAAHQGNELLEREWVMQTVLNFVYDNLEDVKLLLFCAGGTKYDHILDCAAKMEADATLQVMRKAGYPEFTVEDQETILLLMQHQYQMYAEAFRLGYSKERTAAYWKKVSDFYTLGWKQILGLEERNERA